MAPLSLSALTDPVSVATTASSSASPRFGAGGRTGATGSAGRRRFPKKSPRRSPPKQPHQRARGALYAMLAPMGLEDHIQLYIAACPITAREANTSVSTAGVPEEASVTPARLDRDHAPYARMRS